MQFASKTPEQIARDAVNSVYDDNERSDATPWYTPQKLAIEAARRAIEADRAHRNSENFPMFGVYYAGGYYTAVPIAIFALHEDAVNWVAENPNFAKTIRPITVSIPDRKEK